MMNSWLVTPIGLVDVTSRNQFRAAGLSMVLTGCLLSACMSFVKGLALVAVMLVSGLKWWMIVASTSLCDLLPWFA